MDSGCSRHMIGDRRNRITYKPVDKGNVTFGNNAQGKIIAKGVVNLSSGKGKDKKVFYVDGLKHNLLSVS